MNGRHGQWGPPWARGQWGGDPGWRHGGPPPWLTGLLGGAPQHGRRSGPRVRRGDVRAAILDVLSERPMNGYQVISRIAERTGGAWKPSPGSVYPTMQQLEDEGLVEAAEVDGRRASRLTDAGLDYVDTHPDELAATWRPFEEDPPDDDTLADLRPAVGQVMGALWQVVTTGSAEQQDEAAKILADTRRRLYGLLADGDPEP
ncbi:PadR family transcriptional regulator [Nocardioidaceae bacterium SCSIO 66511]|nr:PadR family transcriptional regulator [Nocardioidaceae bacterium SCSIO 66511]